MEGDTNTANVETVSYKKILPKYEVWPGAADNVDYIDLQYDSTVYKVQDEKEDSPSKFNSLPTIKSGRKARYISAIEAISLPKSEAKADLSIDVPDVSVPMTPEVDNDSKLSETTTVVIHESPRGIANEAFEDDEDTLDAKKPRGGESPTHSSSVSYSSHDSTVNMPEVDIDAAIKKKMESEGYSKQMIEGQLKKKWRGEKLYLSFPPGVLRDDQHTRRVCWWLLCLILLAGAITVAALIGVGVIKLPVQDSSSKLEVHNTRQYHKTGPRLGFVGIEGVENNYSERPFTTPDITTSSTPSLFEILISTAVSTQPPAPEVNSEEGFHAKESNEESPEMPSSTQPPPSSSSVQVIESTSPQSTLKSFPEFSTTSTSAQEFSSIIAITEATSTSTQSDYSDLIQPRENVLIEASGGGDSDHDDGSGMEIQFASLENASIEEEKLLGDDDFFLEEKLNTENDSPLELNNDQESTEASISDNYDGSGEVELIITLPQLEGSGFDNDGGVFEITRSRPESFTSGEEVFKALLDFLLPSKEVESIAQDDNISFKQLFSSIGF